MSLAKMIGERLRGYRLQKGWSQEMLAEQAVLHPTYIGQLERGEKNATIESISRVTQALGISLSQLFENLPAQNSEQNIPAKCYQLIQQQPLRDQQQLLNILQTVLSYKNGF